MPTMASKDKAPVNKTVADTTGATSSTTPTTNPTEPHRLQAKWDAQSWGNNGGYIPCPCCEYFWKNEEKEQALYEEYWVRPLVRRANFNNWRSQMQDDRCNNCFRLGACIIPFPEKEGILFTKACYACGFEEECNGVGGELAIKDKATQTDITTVSRLVAYTLWDSDEWKGANQKNNEAQKKVQFGKRRQPVVDAEEWEW